MGEILNFQSPDKEPEEMNREELKAYLARLREQLAELDQREPKRMGSEAYEAWGERHEELEDLVDEALDLLDEME